MDDATSDEPTKEGVEVILTDGTRVTDDFAHVRDGVLVLHSRDQVKMGGVQTRPSRVVWYPLGSVKEVIGDLDLAPGTLRT